MEIICFLILIILAIILFKIIFKINIKKMKEKKENKELEEITDKFPQNVEVAKTMLEMLDNNSVKIEEAKKEIYGLKNIYPYSLKYICENVEVMLKEGKDKEYCRTILDNICQEYYICVPHQSGI